MPHKFRIWAGDKMLLPEDITSTTYRYLLNRDGVVFGIDLRDMKWDGMLRVSDSSIMFQIGRKDREGQETYEGDVVKVRDWEDGRKWLIGTVVYDPEECGYCIEFNTGDPEHGGLGISFGADTDYKILGHKFQEEMQQLIKEQKERFMDPGKEAAVEQPTEKEAV